MRWRSEPGIYGILGTSYEGCSPEHKGSAGTVRIRQGGWALQAIYPLTPQRVALADGSSGIRSPGRTNRSSISLDSQGWRGYPSGVAVRASERGQLTCSSACSVQPPMLFRVALHRHQRIRRHFAPSSTQAVMGTMVRVAAYILLSARTGAWRRL